MVLITPLVNLFALKYLSLSKIKGILFNRVFKILLITFLFILISTTAMLMTQGSDSEFYVTAFSNVIGKDDTYGGKLNPKKVYLSKKYLC